MSQSVQLIQFSAVDFQTEAGIKRLNNWVRQVTTQLWALQGTSGAIQPDNNIDLQGKFKVINQKP